MLWLGRATAVRRGAGQHPRHNNCKGVAMSFAIYMVGFVIFLGGLIWGALAAGVPHLYIGIGTLVLLGLGIFSGVGRTRSKDPS
ncbi:hypothetical protein [Xylophilus ampelinus]|nr:hypothetical protein [Xylophilus ampelinus]MCS4511310.1 hypothetical protein [Xylophilus ampelinus]